MEIEPQNRLGSPQSDFPGTATDMAGMLKRRSKDALRPNAPQLPCDVGLFGDESDQLDLVEMCQQPVED